MDKENKRVKSPLKDMQINKPIIIENSEVKCLRNDHQLNKFVLDQISANKRCELIDIILGDPLLKQLNISLQKQAEQQKRQKLLQTFPLRYKHLIKTELLYRKLQDQMNQHKKQSNQIIQMISAEKDIFKDQNNFLIFEIEKKQRQKQILNLQYQSSKKLMKQDFVKEINSKDQQILDLSNKIIKIKCQKDHLIQFLQETKEECDLLKQQNNRLVINITKCQTQKNNLKQDIQNQSINFQHSRQELILQCSKIKQKLQNQNLIKLQRCQDLQKIIQFNKQRLAYYQMELSDLKQKGQEEQTSKYNEIQEVRMKLLEQIKDKNLLEEELEKNKEIYDHEISDLCYKNNILTSDLQFANHQLLEKSKLFEEEKNKMISQKCLVQILKNQQIKKLQSKIQQLQQLNRQFHENNLKINVTNQILEQNQKHYQQQITSLTNQLASYKLNHKKSQKKSPENRILLEKFKDQLTKFGEINNEKDQKIEEYRAQILNLRNRIREQTITIEKQSLLLSQQSEKFTVDLNNLTRKLNNANKQKQLIRLSLQKVKSNEEKLQNVIRTTQSIQKQEKQIQTSICQSILSNKNQQSIVQLGIYQKQIHKIVQKYQNLFQEFSICKAEYQSQINQKNMQLQKSVLQCKNLKQHINNKTYETKQIELVLDNKLIQLKQFYEKIIEDEANKYKKIILMLKNQMMELYRQFNEKQLMESQIYQSMVNKN